MKYTITTIILLAIAMQGNAQITPWYYGGKADGHSANGEYNFVPGPLSQQVAYSGYKGDGSSMYLLQNFVPTLLPQFVAYSGNKGDGTGMGSLSNFTPEVVKQFVAYFGGQGDGWSNELTPAWALPIVLLSFEGKAEANFNHLEWVTNFEENVDYFLVEKSRDAVQFASIAEVNAVGNSKVESKYSYQDNQDVAGVNYYRLQMTDNDQKFTYSGVIRLVNEKLDYSITIAPNPATDNIRMSFSKALSKASRFNIYDMTGKIVASEIIEKDECVKNINISALSSGKYFIQIRTQNENVNFPFIKQ